MLDNGNIVLCYPNRVDESTLSGGSYNPSLPLSNAKSRVFARRARTTNTLPTSTKFEVLINKPRPLLSLAIAAHNFTTSANVRITMFYDSMMTDLAYDSGVVPVWPSIYDSNDLEWEYDNFWLGTVSDDEREQFTPLFVHFIDAEIVPIVQYMRVEIFDEDNPDGYLEFGRIFFADAWQPTINASLGLAYGYEINSEIESALDNTEYFDRKRPRRTINMTLDRMPTTEAFTRIAGIQRELGIDREILIAYSKVEDENAYARRFIGRLTQADPISEPYVDFRHQTSVNIIEII